MNRRTPNTKTVTIYSERYYARSNQVMPHEALAVARDADVIYAVEQGEIEIPGLNQQRRLVCVLRFERIIRSETTTDQPVSVVPVVQGGVQGSTRERRLND